MEERRELGRTPLLLYLGNKEVFDAKACARLISRGNEVTAL